MIISLRTIFLINTVLFLAFVFFITLPSVTEAVDNCMGTNYFQCSRHGHNDTKNCGWTYHDFPPNDYYAAATSYQFLGHRHGGSAITAAICLNGSNGQCDWFQCSGSSCGPEYGGVHPFSVLDSGGFTVWASGQSSYSLSRYAYVKDAEVRVSASACASYVEYSYGEGYYYSQGHYQSYYYGQGYYYNQGYYQGYYYGQGYYEGAYYSEGYYEGYYYGQGTYIVDCNDGIDNDGDGWVDLEDPGCENSNDAEETNSLTGWQCSDGIDNDGDSMIDANDSSCSSATDNSEGNPGFQEF